MIVFLISSNIFVLPIDASSKKKTTISNSNSTKKKKKSTGKKKKKKYKYDDLQNLFLLITDDTTVDDIEKYISDKGLFYTSEEYKGSNEIEYKIAYTEKVAYQSHADEGSNLKTHFLWMIIPFYFFSMKWKINRAIQHFTTIKELGMISVTTL